jgi:hypothetical protein
MKTAITEMFGIDVPILAFSHCRDVVAAVTKAGGMGVLGAVAHSPEQLEIDLAWIENEVGSLSVPKTRPGMLSRRFARPDSIRRDWCASAPISLEPRRTSGSMKH